MHWAKHLYLSEKTAAKKDKIIRKARRGAGMVGIYFITLASNEENLFDIFHAAYLYLSEKTAAKKDKIIRKARRGAGMVGIYFITLASNEENLFDIFHAAYLKQPAFARQNLYVVGIASGYEEALELVRRMVEDIYRATGGFRVREYFRTEDQER